MTITIQEHGIYERRDGEIVGPAIPLEGSLTFMWKIGPRSYMNNGAFTVSGINAHDIIREIVVGPGWLPHNGGGNPAGGIPVQYVLNYGAMGVAFSKDLNWGRKPGNPYIVAYRIIEEAKAAKEDELRFDSVAVRASFSVTSARPRLRDDLPPIWTVELTDNGGYIVTSQATIPGARPIIRAAVSNDADLLAWLTESEKP